MPPKNPGDIYGNGRVSGRAEFKNPPGTTHGGQQATREPSPLAEAMKTLSAMPVDSIVLRPMTDEQIDDLAPEVGSIWTHANKGLYEVVELLNCEGDIPEHRLKYPPAVSYRSANGKRWTRRLDDWHRSMRLEAAGPRNISAMAYLWACFRLNHSLDWTQPIYDRPEFGVYTFGFVTGRVIGYNLDRPMDRPEVVELHNSGPTYYGNRAPKKLKP